MRSYSIELAKKIFLLVTPRGSFARNTWGESWTKKVDDAYTASSEGEAQRAAKQTNSRLGKQEVHPEPIYKYMTLHWGFSFDYNKGLTIECEQRYFPHEAEVISEPPHPHPDAQKYAYPNDKPFSTPKLAWEHLRAKRLHDLEFAQRSLDGINSDLRACEAALGPVAEKAKNVVSIRKDE